MLGLIPSCKPFWSDAFDALDIVGSLVSTMHSIGRTTRTTSKYTVKNKTKSGLDVEEVHPSLLEDRKQALLISHNSMRYQLVANMK